MLVMPINKAVYKGLIRQILQVEEKKKALIREIGKEMMRGQA